MNKIIVSIIVMGLLFTTFIASITAFGTKDSKKEPRPNFHAIPYANIYVDEKNTQGPWDGTYEHPYKTINDGINNSINGDVVYVFSGIYNEYLKFYKSIKLIGEDAISTVINGLASGIEVSDIDGLKVSGFTLNRSVGIYFFRTSNSIICNNILIRSEITFSNSSFNTIKENIITDSYSEGINLWYKSEYNIVSKNIIKECMNGITAISGNNSIVNNILYGCGISVSSRGTVVSGNSIINMSGSYAIDICWSDDTVISNNKIINMIGFNGIKVLQSKNNTISDNSIVNLSSVNFVSGIEYSDSNYATITRNTINNLSGVLGAYGISTLYSNYITIADNIISDITSNDNGIGISAFTSSHNIIMKNTICQCDYSCIFLGYTSFNKIEENTIIGYWPTDYDFGILLGGLVRQTTISKNTILNNSRGLYLSIGCQNNMIYKNTFSGNGESIGLGRGNNNIGGASNNKIIGNAISNSTHTGIYCEIGSSFNFIYYNNLIDNSPNANDDGLNIWYKLKLLGKSMGNYWDDYTGSDNNGDGIGDTSYGIEPHPQINKDKYPVINPFNIDNIDLIDKMVNKINIQNSQTLQEDLQINLILNQQNNQPSSQPRDLLAKTTNK